jgi:hypothetical protein
MVRVFAFIPKVKGSNFMGDVMSGILTEYYIIELL